MKRALLLVGISAIGCSYLLHQTVSAQAAPGQSRRSTAAPGQTPASTGQAAPMGGGAQGQAGTQRGGLVAYPDRPKAPDAVIQQGKALYGVNCAFCHGSDAGGGAVGPNLWRSAVVLEDQDGEKIMPIVHGARMDKGMPAIPITDAQVTQIAAWLHSIHITSRTDPNAEKINIVTGNAAAGKVFFEKTCSSCHGAADMTKFVAAFPDPKQMQQNWILPGGSSRGFGPAVENPALHVPPVTVAVSSNGKTVEGVLSRIDDFSVSLTEKDGTFRTFQREGDKPKVELKDPLAAHRKLIPQYQDKDIHDLTAYLVTLK